MRFQVVLCAWAGRETDRAEKVDRTRVAASTRVVVDLSFMNLSLPAWTGVDGRLVGLGSVCSGIGGMRSVREFGGARSQRPTRSGEDADAGI